MKQQPNSTARAQKSWQLDSKISLHILKLIILPTSTLLQPSIRWLPLLNAPADYYWYGVHAFDANTVLITGFVDAASKSIGVLRNTKDGGEY